jgi:AraC-like DNA-binding protein
MQRAGVLVELPALLRRRGIDADPLAISAGVDPYCLRDPDARIPFERVCDLAERCCEAAGDETVWLELGAQARVYHLGVFGAYLGAAPDLGTAVRDLVTNHPRYVRGGGPYMMDLPGRGTLVGYRVHRLSRRGSLHMALAAMAFGRRVFLEIGGAEPAEALLSIAEPHEHRPWSEALGTRRLVFRTHHFGLVYPKKALAAPLPGADARLRDELRHLVARFWATAEPDLGERVLRALVPLVLSGSPTLSSVARVIGMRPASLGRALARQGLGFRGLQNRARFEMAGQLLMGAKIPIAEVAEALGYSEVSAFTRFFTSISGGVPPAEWRRLNDSPAASLRPDDEPALRPRASVR